MHGLVAIGEGQMPEDVPHPAPETITQLCDHLVRGVTVPAGITAVLDERHLRPGISEDVIAFGIHRRMQPIRSWS